MVRVKVSIIREHIYFYPETIFNTFGEIRTAPFCLETKKCRALTYPTFYLYFADFLAEKIFSVSEIGQCV